MEYKVVFSPEIDVNPKEFAEIWNNTPECSEIAKAEVSKVQGTQFDMGITAVILIGVATSVAGTAIIELIKFIKNKLEQKCVREDTEGVVLKETEIMQISQPDGTYIIITKMKN